MNYKNLLRRSFPNHGIEVLFVEELKICFDLIQFLGFDMLTVLCFDIAKNLSNFMVANILWFVVVCLFCFTFVTTIRV